MLRRTSQKVALGHRTSTDPPPEEIRWRPTAFHLCSSTCCFRVSLLRRGGWPQTGKPDPKRSFYTWAGPSARAGEGNSRFGLGFRWPRNEIEGRNDRFGKCQARSVRAQVVTVDAGPDHVLGEHVLAERLVYLGDCRLRWTHLICSIMQPLSLVHDVAVSQLTTPCLIAFALKV